MEVPNYRNAIERSLRSVTAYTKLTVADVNEWVIDPDIQRDLRLTPKVKAIGIVIGQTKLIPSTITIGIYDGKQYLLDAHHRVEGWKMYVENGGEDGVCALVNWIHFDTQAAMALKFVELQMCLVRMRPDDGLRALQHSSPPLQLIKDECPYVGFGAIQRCNTTSAVLSMSVLLRCWMGSKPETPVTSSGAALDITLAMNMVDARQCADFVALAHRAWGRVAEYSRLWGALNLTLCMWLYRRMVLDTTTTEVTHLTPDQFRMCLVALTNSTPNIDDYVEWLRSKTMNHQNRQIAMQRYILALFSARIRQERGQRARKPVFPTSPWQAGQ